MNDEGTMSVVLRRIAFVMGLVLLVISIHWSQVGFGFVAGDSGGTQFATLIGYAIALAMTVIQFVFSTKINELNASLIVFGLGAYAYSIYTNYLGIIEFQGDNSNHVMAAILGFAMDGVPEPLMAWGLYESLSGDFVGNLFKGAGSFLTGKPLGGGRQKQHQPQQHSKQDTQPNQQPQFRPMNPDLMEKMKQAQGKAHMQERRENGGGQHKQGKQHQNNRERHG